MKNHCNLLQEETDRFAQEFSLEYLHKKCKLTAEERIGYLTAMTYYAEDMICSCHEQDEILEAMRRTVREGRYKL